MERVATIAITVLAFHFFYKVVQTHDPGSSLFSWHPTCMVLGQIIMFESIALFKHIPRGWRVTIHGMIAGTATLLLYCGFYAIYQNKINLQKTHFTSWHGLIGVSTVALMGSQSFFGTLLKYGKKLLQRVGLAKLIKVGHRYNGLITLFLSFLAVILATNADIVYSFTIALPATVHVLRLFFKTKEKEEKATS